MAFHTSACGRVLTLAECEGYRDVNPTYYHTIFMLSFILLYRLYIYFLFLLRMPGNGLLVEASQYNRLDTVHYVCMIHNLIGVGDIL